MYFGLDAAINFKVECLRSISRNLLVIINGMRNPLVISPMKENMHFRVLVHAMGGGGGRLIRFISP